MQRICKSTNIANTNVSSLSLMGKLLYDKEMGEMSIRQAADMLGTSYHHVYYAIQEGRLKASRKGCAWMINEDDAKAYGTRIKKRKTYLVHAS